MVQVRGASHSSPFPRQDKDRAAILRVHEGDRLSYRQTPRGEDEMATARRADACLTANLIAQAVGPGTRCIDHHPGMQLSSAFSGNIAHEDAIDAPIMSQEQPVRAGVVERCATIAHGLADHTKHKASVVGDRIQIAETALELVRADVRRKKEEIITLEVRVIPFMGE